MILRLFTAAALLCILACATAIGGGIRVGMARSFPAGALPLAHSRCSFPCIFEIIPGRTTRGAAGETLLRTLVAMGERPNVFRMPAPGLPDTFSSGYTFEIRYTPDERVTTMRLIASTNTTFGSLADVLLLGGQPVRLFRSCSGMFPIRMLMVFGEHEQTVAELLLRDSLTLMTPVILLDSAEPGVRTVFDARAGFGCSVEIEWRGLAPLWLYQQT